MELVEIPLHLGPLHPMEQALVLGLAFGPFLLLALTIWISRRRTPVDHSPKSADRERSEL